MRKPQTDNIDEPLYTPGEAATANPARFTEITVDTDKILASWKRSLFSFEWLDAEGNIKPESALKDSDRARYHDICHALDHGKPVEMPVLGIGVMENVEIGSGRAALLTLAARGHKTIRVHIPQSNESDFKRFRSRVS